MAKTIIPEKVIIEFDQGSFSSGAILYKINDDGVISKTKSIGIKNSGFSKSTLNGVLQKIVNHIYKSEGINE